MAPVVRDLASNTDHRIYIVLHWPDHPAREGCWSGAANQVWNRMMELTPRGSLMGSGIKLKKVKTLVEGQQLWDSRPAYKRSASPVLLPVVPWQQLP